MDRLAYTPRLEIFIRNERSQRVIDVSDDIINGNVTLRLNAMSTATFTLQNKFGKYLTPDTKDITKPQERYVFDPMDRIVIRMARVGTAFPIFSGYLDEVPYYQLYPGAVTFTASDALKLLQYTFFDPGLVYLTTYFASFGWIYDPTSGTISTPDPGRLGNFDIGGGVGDIIKMTLGGDSNSNILGIANWPEKAINVVDLPKSFVNTVAKLMKKDIQTQQAQTQSLEEYVDRIFGVNKLVQSNSNSTSSSSTGSFTPPQGNLSAIDIANIVKSKGLTATQAVQAVAIAYAESSFNNSAINYNTDGSFDLGIWQINTIHAGSDGRGLPEPSGYGTPPADISLADFMKASTSFPSDVQSWLFTPNSVFDPNHNADLMMGVSGNGTSWTPWSTYLGDRYNSFLGQAQSAVNQVYGVSPLLVQPPNVNNTVGQDPTKIARTENASATSIATKVVKTAVAESQKNIREVGDNSGPQILKYQQVTGAIGLAWCASFVQWVYQTAGRPLNETHLSAYVGNIVSAAEISPGWQISNADPQPGDIVCWSDKHTGIVVQRQGNKFWTVEGNAGAGANAVVSNGPYTLGSSSADVDGAEPSFIRPSGVGTAIANAAVGVSATYDPSGTNADTALTADEVRVIANESVWMTQQTQSNDVNLAQILTGSRALSNDISFLEWISQLVQSSGRVFRATPDGTFLAFFPDRFGFYYSNPDGTTGRNPYFTIEDIEIIDLTVQHNDRNLVTHVFTTGPYSDPNAGVTPLDYSRSFIASVEEPAFSAFINVVPQDPFSGSFDSNSSFDTLNFLRKYGARPYKNDLDTVRNPILAWMAGWMKFSELWAQTFTASGTFTFLPELFPGGLVGFGNRFTMFVEEVTHSFDRSTGFTTEAELSSLSSNSFAGTVQTGLPSDAQQGKRYLQGAAPGVIGSGN